MRLEILYTVKSVPLMSLPTVTLFFIEVRGYSKLYNTTPSTPGGRYMYNCIPPSLMIKPQSSSLTKFYENITFKVVRHDSDF